MFDGDDDAGAAIAAFADAVTRADEDAAEAACSVAGWLARHNSPRRLFRQLTREPIALSPEGPARVAGDRAVGALRLAAAGRPDARLLVLLHRAGPGWMVEGIAHGEGHARAFLACVAPGLLTWGALPDSPTAHDAAAGLLEAVHAGDVEGLEGTWARTLPGQRLCLRLLQLARGTSTSVEAGEARELPSARRYAFELRFRRPDAPDEALWVSMARAADDDAWLVTGLSAIRSVEVLLSDPAAGPPPVGRSGRVARQTGAGRQMPAYAH